eukprot:Nk52_evm21s222 gene=Nk52_evmTU21s222
MVEDSNSGILEALDRLFGTVDLYKVLDCSDKASQSEIKKCYRKQALKLHPDRHHSVSEKEKEIITERFQCLAVVYSVLSDEEKRKVYDESGQILDGSEAGAFDGEKKNWADYWRNLYKEISKKDILEFEKLYVGSAEEAEDVRKCYVQCEGDMSVMLENIMCSGIGDEERFRKIINKGIEEGSLPSFPSFTNESESKKKSRKRKAQKQAEIEAREAEELAKELGMKAKGKKGKKNDEADLFALINQRQAGRKSFMDDLEAKYSKKSSKSKRSAKAKEGPSEEEFQRIQQDMLNAKKK